MTIWKKMLILVMLNLTLLMGAFAKDLTLADVKTNMVISMQQDGYLNSDAAKEVIQKYISKEDSSISIGEVQNTKNIENVEGVSQWMKYISIINVMKVLGIILLLFAFGDFLSKIILKFWRVIASIPLLVYQVVFLSLSIYGTLFPKEVWESQYFYIVLFCSIANILLICWILNEYKVIVDFFEKLIKLNFPIEVSVSFIITVYFMFLTSGYESKLFGAISILGLTVFLILSVMKVENWMKVEFGKDVLKHIFIVGVLFSIIMCVVQLDSFLLYSNTIAYFNLPLQLSCALCLFVPIVFKTSPMTKEDKKERTFYFAGLFVLALFSAILYVNMNMVIIPMCAVVVIFLVALQWLANWSFKKSFLVGLLSMGITMFGLAWLLEKYSQVVLDLLNLLKGVI